MSKYGYPMCPEKRTGSQSASEHSDVKATRSRKQYGSRSLVITRRPAAQYPDRHQNEVDAVVSVDGSVEVSLEE